MKRHITNEADARLAAYLPVLPETLPPGMDPPAQPQLGEGVIDAPFVRLFNFLRMWELFLHTESSLNAQ